MSDIQQILCYKPQNINPKNSSKIYFACHPSEFSNHFDEVFKDIIETAEKADITCTVWYRNPEITLTEGDSEILLSQCAEMQLVVVPVTQALLDDPTTVMETEIALAKSKNIPILPLLDDASLISIYSKPEFFGDIQFLSKKLPDATALPYDKKLTDFLKSVLVGDKMRQEIQSAFDAYIFLSYRKKDRAAAQELMRLIHKNDFCRDIAIWYDEFLTPGENFNQAIQEALHKSELFTLVVTPNITEPHNYVLEHEYPMAMNAQKPILPVESVPTDRAELERCFHNLPTVADAHNPTELSDALLDRLKKIATRENDTPYHNYLIGLAYLNGIDVETDPKKAEELLTLAAKADLPEAMMTLSDMYKTGKGVTRDYQKSLEWLENANGIYIQLNNAHKGEYVNQVINTLAMLASFYLDFGRDRSSERHSLEAIMYCKSEFLNTGDEQYISKALANYLLLIDARVNIRIKQNPVDISKEEIQNYSCTLYEQAAKFIEECNLSEEQIKNIGYYVWYIYNQLSIYYATASNPEKSKEYQARATGLMETTGEMDNILTTMLDSIANGGLDFNGTVGLTERYLNECAGELELTHDAQKQACLSQLLSTTSALPEAIASLAMVFSPEDNPDEFSRINALLHRYVAFFDGIDVDLLSHSALNDLASVYQKVSEFEQNYGSIEDAKAFNLKCQKLAKKSFEYHPTQKAYALWVSSANDFTLLDPNHKFDKQTWLQFEKLWRVVFNNPREPLNGLTYLATVYNNLMFIAEQNEDYDQLLKYSSEAYHLAKKRFSHSNTVENEIRLLEAHRMLLIDYFRCDQNNIDREITQVMNRCVTLLNDYQKFELNKEQYERLCFIYCHLAYLLGSVCAVNEDLERAIEYINLFLSVAPNHNENGEFDNDIEAAQSMLLMIEMYNNTPDDSDGEE